MPNFVAKIRLPFLDRKRISNVLYAKVKKVIVLALFEFLKEALKHIPVDTGMAQGTLIPLSLAIRRSAGEFISIPTSPPQNKSPYSTIDGERVLRTPELGATYGNPRLIDDIIKRFVSQINVQYGTALRYFTLLDIQGGKGHAPWGAYATGAAAFNAYLKANLKNEVAKVLDFKNIVEIKADRQTVSKSETRG